MQMYKNVLYNPKFSLDKTFAQPSYKATSIKIQFELASFHIHIRDKELNAHATWLANISHNNNNNI